MGSRIICFSKTYLSEWRIDIEFNEEGNIKQERKKHKEKLYVNRNIIKIEKFEFDYPWINPKYPR